LCSFEYSFRNAVQAASIASAMLLQHRLAGAQLPHAPLETRARRNAHLQPETAQNASDAELDVQ
jgi:hypothetical protein